MFNSSFTQWNIDNDLWIFRAIKWVLIRLLVWQEYGRYITVGC